MSNATARRSTRRPRSGAIFGWSTVLVVASVMAVSVIAVRFGGSAAAGEDGAKADAAPISLAGRWIGRDYGYAGTSADAGCNDNGCRMAYDIVPCKDGWCGIALNDDNSCGATALHLTADVDGGRRVFKGQLERVKGAAPYTVQAWLNTDKQTGVIDLHFIGNTGAKLLMFRRSFPLEARLARNGDAACALAKTTS